MGIDEDFGKAFAKAQDAASSSLPSTGTIFVSVKDDDKTPILDIAQSLASMGFQIVATSGTASALESRGIKVQHLKKISEGSPNVTDLIHKGQIALVINTPSGKKPRKDEVVIRSLAVSKGIPCITTIEGAIASLRGIQAIQGNVMSVTALQEYHKMLTHYV